MINMYPYEGVVQEGVYYLGQGIQSPRFFLMIEYEELFFDLPNEQFRSYAFWLGEEGMAK